MIKAKPLIFGFGIFTILSFSIFYLMRTADESYFVFFPLPVVLMGFSVWHATSKMATQLPTRLGLLVLVLLVSILITFVLAMGGSNWR